MLRGEDIGQKKASNLIYTYPVMTVSNDCRTDAELEPSDEEVLGYSSSDSDDNDEPAQPAKPARIEQYSEDEEPEAEEEEEEGWGTSRKDYYNADIIETEIDAQEEEEEARRLQQKKLQKMSEADFGFDESEWLDTAENEDQDGDVVTELLKDVEITPAMSPEERLRILQTRYPEFELLANEFLNLQPVLQDLQAQMDGVGAGKELVVKCRALAAYVSSLSMYFALLTSPSRSSSKPKTLDPAEIRDHPIMDSLLQCRSIWAKVKGLKTPSPTGLEAIPSDEPMADISLEEYANGIENKPEKKSMKSHAATARAVRFQVADEAVDDLSIFYLLENAKKSPPNQRSQPTTQTIPTSAKQTPSPPKQQPKRQQRRNPFDSTPLKSRRRATSALALGEMRAVTRICRTVNDSETGRRG